jgi:very-short-patch-repair endonuclease
MWGLLDRQPRIVTVTAVGRHRHSSGILHVHRSNNLSAQDVRARHRLPVTNPARTLLDLATTEHDLERAVAEARVQGLIRPGQIEAAIGRAPKHPGISPITALLSVDSGPAWTRSDGERRLLQLIRDANLPLPLVNQRVLTYEVDFVWPAQKLIVETDGHRFHGHRGAFEADRRRDQALAAAGYRVMRITWRQLVAEPTVVIARIAMALAQTAAA